MTTFLLRAWYSKAAWPYLLLPLTWIFRLLVLARRRLLSARAAASPLPTIVVGNITVGGAGKTPAVIALALALKALGWRPGMVSRGYGARPPSLPWRVQSGDSSEQVGDEALLLARHTGCPLMLDPDRPRAVAALADSGECDVIISDDGLQHYAMARDLELLVIDGERGLGNGLCLPAGPLREPPARLEEVDLVLVNGEPARTTAAWLSGRRHYSLSLRALHWTNLRSGQKVAPDALPLPVDDGIATSVQAIAGIGNPERFFGAVRDLGYRVEGHAFADHHRYSPADLAFADDEIIVMTEKDAVKCAAFAGRNCWFLTVAMVLPAGLAEHVSEKLCAV